jgi:hypothetical protein
MKKFLNAIMAWMLAHPVVEHLLESLVVAIVMGVYGAIQTGMTDPKTGLTYGAISAALVLAVKGWYGLNKTLILAQAQDQLQALAANGQGSAAYPASVPGAVVAAVPPPASSALTPVVKMLFLAGALFALTSGAFAQDSIYVYHGGLNLTKETVTSKINGDFLCLGVQGGIMPLSFNNGILTLNSANPIATVDYLFVKGAVEPSTNGGIQVDAGWWLGPIFGLGAFQAVNNSVAVAHGLAGLTEGANLGLGNLSLSEAIDLDTKAFYFGPSLSAGFDLGGFSITQVH